jgi:hypothetical protein
MVKWQSGKVLTFSEKSFFVKNADGVEHQKSGLQESPQREGHDDRSFSSNQSIKIDRKFEIF